MRGCEQKFTSPEGSPACILASHQVPLPEEIQVSPGDTEIHRVEPEDVANQLTAFHWELFRCVHEVGTGWCWAGGKEGEVYQMWGPGVRQFLQLNSVVRPLTCSMPSGNAPPKPLQAFVPLI